MKKNYTLKKLFSFLAFILFASFVYGQTNIYTETFNDTLNITNTPDFQTDGYGDFFWWGQDGDFGMTALDGEDGLYYIGAEDTDADGMPGECSITLPSVSLVGYSNVKASIMLAAPQTAKYDEPDYIIYEYAMNGSSTYTTLGAFYGHDWVNGDATNGTMREDTNLDGYANELGTELTSTFQTFEYAIDPLATAVVLRVRFKMDSGSEEIGIDNLQLNEIPTAVDVTMNVDMNYQETLGNFNPLTDFVDIAGDMNGWSGTTMTDTDGDGIWSVTITGAAIGTVWNYKFRINGTVWETITPDRNYTVVVGTNVVDHFFNNDAGPVDVLFTVIDGTESYLDIELKGTFTNWNLEQMYDDGTHGDAVANDHTWSVTLSVSGGAHEWGAIENDGTQWGLWLIVGNNMALTVNTDGTYSGQDSYEIPAPGNIDVTFNVNMNYQITLGNFVVGTDFVDIAGSMNGFGGSGAMDDTDGDGIYSITIGGFSAASPLNLVEYKFRINGTDWEPLANNRSYTVVDPGPNEVTHWYNDEMPPLPPSLIFSEYIEGTSNHKAFELYNLTSSTIYLDNYAFPNVSNAPNVVGEYEYWNTFTPGDSILPGDVYVVAHGSADAAIQAHADMNHTYLSNGDDGFALVMNDGVWVDANNDGDVDAGEMTGFTVIDRIGDWNGDPGTGWAVAGVPNATANHTLVRKSSVTSGNTDWTASAGTDATTSEWVVLPENEFGYIGSHPHTFSSLVDVTFNVDMSYQISQGNFIVGTDFLDVAGTFNAWAGGDLFADADLDEIYTATVTGIGVGDTIYFKCRINGDWNTSEFPGGGPERMYIVQGANNVVDFWYNDELPISVVSIYDIQYTTDPSGDSPYQGQYVTTSGLVTAIDTDKYWVQDGIGAWNGIYVYDNTNMPAIGDHITITAEVDEYYNLTELYNVSSFVVNSSANTLPPVTVVTTGDVSQEMYESVLIQVANAECSNANAGYGEWHLDDGSGTAVVDDAIYAFTPDSGNVYNVTGVLYFSFGAFKLLPRDMMDIEDVTVVGDTQTLTFPSGWSIFSSYITPFDPLMDDVFASVVSDVTLVKNGDGQVYWPAFFLNAIGNLTIGQGYQINMVNAQTLDVIGTQVVPETTPFTIPAGWSIVGYLRTSPGDAAAMFASISTELVLCKNGNGQVYWPLYGLNMIGNLMPGEGYQMNMSTPQTFTYAANGPVAKSNVTIHTPSYFNLDMNTGSNMTLGIPTSAWSSTPNIGDEVGVFTKSGLLVGSAVYVNNNMAVAIWGSNDFSENAMESGDEFVIKVWNHLSGTESIITVSNWLMGDEYYKQDGISVASAISNGNTLVNYPNPANAYTEIEFTISNDTYVNLSIYNVLGEKVETLVSGSTMAGTHKVMLNTSSYMAGTYFYVLNTNESVKTNSLQVVK